MKRLFIIFILTTAAWSLAFAQSPYIDKVYEFCPAPGQFINTMPMCRPTENAEIVMDRVNTNLVNNKRSMVCLGSFGGYVTFGFDHMVENVHGCYDLSMMGNAFISFEMDGKVGGSSEPGSVMVSYDANGNGEPDDEWYELAGSEYYKPTTIHNYEITYYRPDSNHVATPDSTYTVFIDTTYIRWVDNVGGSGYVIQNSFHKQNYYPNWIEADSMTFRGTLVAGNAVKNEKTGNYTLFLLDYGYVDNYPNNNDRSKFNIDWAVDEDGKPVDLPGIHFVKVYTCMNQYAGSIGDTSTEFAGASDLHLTGEDTEDVTGLHSARATYKTDDNFYDLCGRKVANPSSGIYIYNGKKIILK